MLLDFASNFRWPPLAHQYWEPRFHLFIDGHLGINTHPGSCALIHESTKSQRKYTPGLIVGPCLADTMPHLSGVINVGSRAFKKSGWLLSIFRWRADFTWWWFSKCALHLLHGHFWSTVFPQTAIHKVLGVVAIFKKSLNPQRGCGERRWRGCTCPCKIASVWHFNFEPRNLNMRIGDRYPNWSALCKEGSLSLTAGLALEFWWVIVHLKPGSESSRDCWRSRESPCIHFGALSHPPCDWRVRSA